MRDPLDNISPLDGRYGQKVDELRQFFSEASLMRHRLIVEVEWFIFLCNTARLKGTFVLKPVLLKEIRSIYEYFDLVDAKRVKEIEKITNHDVKAIEYFIKEKLKGSAFEPYLEFVHFGCTSEDINNLSYAMMLKGAMEGVIFPVMTGVAELVYQLAKKYKSVAMMSRTHGQPATPTTVGKEFVNFIARMERQMASLKLIVLLGKMNGAVGNFNAHVIAYPKLKWMELSTKFIQGLGLEVNAYTTQIEPHDYNAEIFDAIRRFNTVLIDMNRDIWSYISIGYFKQHLKAGEVGSSTMPHKVNPIDFENSEGNLGMANAILGHLAEKLPLSRMQRDLTDSTVIRNIGSALAYSLLAYKNCIQGLHKIDLNKKVLEDDLDVNWELLAEPIQTAMRRYGVKNAYEQLKSLTRGKSVNKKIVHKFIDGLDIPAGEKKRLKSLTPSKYIGLAVELVDGYQPNFLK
ncbi:adenylosuccinate lyase [Patescibacteria group bacterium]|nr:adenylosuccinate lyase [Patescibacteria group bacterium]MBU1702809.1 adenylosuccinate lyase [Patescibacteria group bacterium]MBU1953798.1 adenylosuccinate lyase [Patescibacteria group bacterium]